jgi:hypothetical protein
MPFRYLRRPQGAEAVLYKYLLPAKELALSLLKEDLQGTVMPVSVGRRRLVDLDLDAKDIQVRKIILQACRGAST